MGNKLVGNRFKEYREKAGFTQAELARKVGCTEQYISVIERGINFPAYNRLVACSISWMSRPMPCFVT